MDPARCASSRVGPFGQTGHATPLTLFSAPNRNHMSHVALIKWHSHKVLVGPEEQFMASLMVSGGGSNGDSNREQARVGEPLN